MVELISQSLISSQASKVVVFFFFPHQQRREVKCKLKKAKVNQAHLSVSLKSIHQLIQIQQTK